MPKKKSKIKDVDLTKWLSVAEMSHYFGISKETTYRMIKEKTIPVHRVGRLWKFNAQEVD